MTQPSEIDVTPPSKLDPALMRYLHENFSRIRSLFTSVLTLTEIVHVFIQKSDTQTLDTLSVITWNNVWQNIGDGWNPSTHTFTASLPGLYIATATIRPTTAADGTVDLQLFHNVSTYNVTSVLTSRASGHIAAAIKMNAGDTLQIKGVSSIAGVSFGGTNSNNWAFITKIIGA